jgi:hypothetical protein
VDDLEDDESVDIDNLATSAPEDKDVDTDTDSDTDE